MAFFKITDGADFQTGIVNDGTFVADVDTDYDFAGSFSGTGSFIKDGAGTFTFLGDYSFDRVTSILAGGLRISGTIDPTTEINLHSGTLDISGSSQTIAAFSGG